MIKLYHNTRCGTSRKVKALLEEKGVRFEVVDYLKNPPSKTALAALAKKMKNEEGGRALLRTKEAAAKEQGLLDASEGKIIEAIAASPILLNRPIVETKTKAIAARPAERVLEIL